MKQYFTGFFTAVCLTASVFIFMGSQNKNLVTAVTLRDGGTVEIISNHKISGNKIERVGKYTEWYYGRIKQEGHYKNDLKDGKWTSWEDNRDGDWFKQTEGTYKDGKPHGKITIWHRNGKKGGEGTYKDGKPHGKINKWHFSGKKWKEETYNDGKEISRKEWNKDGSVKE
jgi:antitoxin component YwqK of YwqJK toxin-antitoxin module